MTETQVKESCARRPPKTLAGKVAVVTDRAGEVCMELTQRHFRATISLDLASAGVW